MVHSHSQGPARRHGDYAPVAFINQVRISDRAEVQILDCGVSAMQTMIHDPRHILRVDDPEYQRLLWIQIQ